MDPFGSANPPTCTSDNPCGIFSVKIVQALAQHELQPPVGTILWRNSVIFQLGYVGSAGHHLLLHPQISQPRQPSARTPLAPRSSSPLLSLFPPPYTYINQIESIGTSNYSSLQATARVLQMMHHLSTQAAYTWSHTFDK